MLTWKSMKSPSLVAILVAMTFSGTQALADDQASRPKIIKFTAGWCKSCRDLTPVMKRIEKKYADRVEVVTVDVDDPASAKLVDEYGVSVLPTVVFIAGNGDHCVTTGSGEENIAWGLKQIVH